MGAFGLPFVLERLHWPVPRVRWESARALADLVQKGDEAVRGAMLAWNAKQYLESDAAILPSIIQAFNLSRYFSFDEVHHAIAAPSILSDTILAELYPNESNTLLAFRFDFTATPTVDPHAQRLFEDGIGSLVPRIFHSLLSAEDRRTPFPFLAQWLGEWAALRQRYDQPYSDYPHFFFAGDRGSTGSLDVRQRAVFVSAFLRTLHRAQLQWGMPQRYASDLAGFALPFNAGLAPFDASDRPSWSANFREEHAELGAPQLARALWRRAAATSEPGFEPLALDVVDHDEHLAVRVRITRVIAPRGERVANALAEPPWIETKGPPWELGGELPPGRLSRKGDELQPLCVAVHAPMIARSHIDLLAGRLLLADPLLADGRAIVACAPDAVTLSDSRGELSRLALWYSDWSPIHPTDFSFIGSLTSCRSDALTALRRSCDVSTPRLARVTVARREQTWESFTQDDRVYRL